MIAPNSETIRAFYDNYYRPMKLRSRSPETRRLYEFSIRNFSRFLCREALLSDFNDDTVSRLMGWMVERRRSPYTVNKERSQLLAIWRFACRKKFVGEWPDVEPEVQPTRVPRAWTAGQIDQLFGACATEPGLIGPVPANLWWTGLHLLGWDTGERIWPLRNAQWPWFDLSIGLCRVPAEWRKGKRADRVYKLHEQTVVALRQIQASAPAERRFAFPFPYSMTYIYRLYGKLQARAGLPAGREFRFHCLRKSVATHGKVAGMDPQALMGHIDGRTTQKYLDPTICGEGHPSEILFRPKLQPPSDASPRVDPQVGDR